ncbi:MAG TPA: serpin family protein, partial [Gammaproteobacteria bacterium]
MVSPQIQRFTALLFAALLGIATASAALPPPDINGTVAGNNRFALDLYSKLRDTKGNLFFSPYSISTAMAMCYGGARGDTAEEMAKVLHFTRSAQPHPAFTELTARLEALQRNGQVQLHMANSLWPRQGYPLLVEYLTLSKHHYAASITPLDFANTAEASQTINRWVENNTEQKIRDMVRPGDLDPKAALVLVNAIYFKGNWASRFDPRRTQRAKFSLPGNTTTLAPMLYQKGRFRYAQLEGVQLLELPYAGNGLSMVVILPTTRGKLARIEDSLTPSTLDGWLS